MPRPLTAEGELNVALGQERARHRDYDLTLLRDQIEAMRKPKPKRKRKPPTPEQRERIRQRKRDYMRRVRADPEYRRLERERKRKYDNENREHVNRISREGRARRMKN